MEKIIVHGGNGAKRNQASVGVMLRDELNRSCLIPFGVSAFVSFVLATLEFFHALTLAILFHANDGCYK